MEEVKAVGVAYLCFFDDASRFYGTMITSTREQFGLVGECVEHATGDTDVHECCIDELSKVMNITIIDYNNFNSEYILKDVMKSGGDNCSLVSPRLSFITDDLLVGSKAEECIRKFFPSKFLNRDCFVCIGDIKLDTKYEEPSSEKHVSCCH